jgi:hypothetical protein
LFDGWKDVAIGTGFWLGLDLPINCSPETGLGLFSAIRGTIKRQQILLTTTKPFHLHNYIVFLVKYLLGKCSLNFFSLSLAANKRRSALSGPVDCDICITFRSFFGFIQVAIIPIKKKQLEDKQKAKLFK